jgi:hypothetical protein
VRVVTGRKALLVALSLSLGCCFAAAACGGGPTTTTLPVGWSTFQGEMISLALPDSFTGGNPQDPAVAAALEALAASLGTTIDVEGYDLVAVGEPDADGSFPLVNGYYVADPAMGELSMQEVVDQTLQGLESGGIENAEIVTEDIEGERADLIVQGVVASESGEIPVRMRYVLLKGDTWFCYVQYMCDEMADASLEEIYGISAETITVEGQ